MASSPVATGAGEGLDGPREHARRRRAPGRLEHGCCLSVASGNMSRACARPGGWHLAEGRVL
jgi:hypothetical protein